MTWIALSDLVYVVLLTIVDSARCCSYCQTFSVFMKKLWHWHSFGMRLADIFRSCLSRALNFLAQLSQYFSCNLPHSDQSPQLVLDLPHLSSQFGADNAQPTCRAMPSFRKTSGVRQRRPAQLRNTTKSNASRARVNSQWPSIVDGSGERRRKKKRKKIKLENQIPKIGRCFGLPFSALGNCLTDTCFPGGMVKF